MPTLSIGGERAADGEGRGGSTKPVRNTARARPGVYFLLTNPGGARAVFSDGLGGVREALGVVELQPKVSSEQYQSPPAPPAPPSEQTSGKETLRVSLPENTIRAPPGSLFS